MNSYWDKRREKEQAEREEQEEKDSQKSQKYKLENTYGKWLSI